VDLSRGSTVTLTLESVDVPADEDEAPDIDSPGYDPEAPYGRTKSGRIRKRPVGNRSVAVGNGSVRNAAKARQAAAAVCQLNTYFVLGLLTSGMHETAGTLAAGEDKFRTDLENAFALDPALADYVLKLGVKSGKVALISAFVLHFGKAVPSAVTEYREMRVAA
jgi:hypothetical protein